MRDILDVKRLGYEYAARVARLSTGGASVMQRGTSKPPLALPIDFGGVSRMKLEFEDVRRDAGSFSAFVFLNIEAAFSEEALGPTWAS